MKIMFYCQYVYGMGHFFRSLELARALRDHRVLLVVGGQAVDADIPPHVELIRLPSLFMDEYFTTLISGEDHQEVVQVQQERRRILDALLTRFRPDILMTELYPFGRSFFEYELVPLLTGVRQGRFGSIRTVCSLRDVLVEKRDPQAYEQRVVDRLNAWYDLLLVHADPRVISLNDTFGRTADIAVPVVYTGFVATTRPSTDGSDIRAMLNLSPAARLIVASAGGGRSGYPLLSSVLDACRRLKSTLPLHLKMFAGPFMAEDLFDRLQAKSTPSLQVSRFTTRFIDHLAAADLSISMAGYNTCMNLLVTGVPALVYPYARQQEQPMRVAKIKGLIPFKTLTGDDLTPDRLAGLMADMMSADVEKKAADIDTSGAENTARRLAQWFDADERGPNGSKSGPA